MTTARARTRPFLPLFRRPLSPKPYLLLLSPAAPLSQRPSPFLPPLLSLPLSPLPAAVCPRPHNASPPASGVEQVLPVTAVNVATVAALSALWQCATAAASARSQPLHPQGGSSTRGLATLSRCRARFGGTAARPPVVRDAFRTRPCRRRPAVCVRRRRVAVDRPGHHRPRAGRRDERADAGGVPSLFPRHTAATPPPSPVFPPTHLPPRRTAHRANRGP